MRWAMNSASSLTQPSSSEPRVCCQSTPRKYTPGTSVTPRRCVTAPSSSKTGSCTKEWSSRNPVAHTTPSTASSGAVGERDAAALSRGRARPQLDAALARGARAGADERLLVLQAPREARIHGLVHQARGVQVAEEVSAEDALRQRHLTGADGQVDLPGLRELLADLVAGVA